MCIYLSTRTLVSLICGTRFEEGTPGVRAERCIGQMHLAVAMVHELAHAFRAAKRLSTDLSKSGIEPFFDQEWAAELGYSLENAILGGVFRTHPNPAGSEFAAPRHTRLRRQYLASLTEFPHDVLFWRSPATINHHQHYASPMTSVRYPLPTLLSAMFFSRDFWAENVARFGVQSLRLPKYFRTDVFVLDEMSRAFSFKLNPGDETEGESYSRGGVDELVQKLILDLREQHRNYRRIRPWYDIAHEDW